MQRMGSQRLLACLALTWLSCTPAWAVLNGTDDPVDDDVDARTNSYGAGTTDADTLTTDGENLTRPHENGDPKGFTTPASKCSRPAANQSSFDPSSGQRSCVPTSSTPRRRRGRYSGGALNKEDYTHFMSIVNPIRFSLHVFSVLVLTLTVVAFAKVNGSSVSNKLIIALNSFELASSLFNIVFYSFKYALAPTDKINIIWVIACNYIIVVCRRIVFPLNMTMSVQRLLAIAFPLKTRYTSTSSFVVMLLSISVTVVLSHTYLALMFEAKEIGPGVYVMGYTGMYAAHKFLFDCAGYITKTVFSYMPVVLSVFVNALLVCTMRRHSVRAKVLRSSEGVSERSRKDRHTSLMILVSTMTFTLLSLPPNINQMISTFIADYGTGRTDHYLYSAVKGVVNGVQTLGDITNFVIYMSMSATFRQQILSCMRTRGLRSNPPLKSARP